MMTIKGPEQKPLPGAAAGPTEHRPTPCVGIFGWRKDGPASPVPPRDEDAAKRRYPVG